MDRWGGSHALAGQFGGTIFFEQLPSFQSSRAIHGGRVHRAMKRLAVFLLISGILSPPIRPARITPPLTAQQVLAEMETRDRARSAALSQYVCNRRYVLINRRFHKTAE